MYGIVIVLCLGAVTLVANQIRLLVKRKSNFIPVKVGLNIIGLSFVGFYAVLISIVQENKWAFLSEHSYSLENLVTIILAAGGLDMIFIFSLALLSGFMLKFNRRYFAMALISWFFIIFINEMLIQRFILPSYRTGSLCDVFSNMLGGVLPGLFLSLKRLYKK